MHTRRIIAALILSGFALESLALTIGRPQGAVWIGKPLDLVIPLSLDEAENAGDLCIESDVVQGDARLPGGRITVSLDPGPTPTTPRVHLRSTVAINEPVVNVSLSAGCRTKSTRNFVLLSDVLPQNAPPVLASASEGAAGSGFGTPLPAQRAPAPPPVRRSASAAPNGAGGADVAPKRRASPPRSNQAVAVNPRPRPAPKPAVVAPPKAVAAAAPPPAATRPVLQIDPLEPSAAKDAALKASPESAVIASADDTQRAQAIAQWRALPVEPEAAERESQRLQALEATLAALRTQSTDTQNALTALRSELAQARESRYNNPLVYGLVAALLLTLIALLLLWRAMQRARTAPDWWLAAEAEREAAQSRLPRRGALLDDDMDDEERAAHAADVQAARRDKVLAAQVAQEEQPDTSGFGMLEPRLTSAVTPAAAPQRQLSADEMVDVQQHAEFFLSLGQHEQAIAVLRHHIETNTGTSALAYLDLLKILHDLGRREAYDKLAEEFQRDFNAQVPAFDSFTDKGRGLDQYKDVLARIEAIWPEPGTLALIEHLIFRKPGAHSEAFDLPAYKELLLLYSVARETLEPASDWAPMTDTVPAPLPARTQEEPPTVVMPLAAGEPEAPKEPATPASLFVRFDPEGEQATSAMPLEDLPKFEPSPPSPEEVRHVPMSEMPAIDMDLADFDRTAYETLPAPLEPLEPPGPKAPPPPSTDPHIIDFDLFDPATEAEIAPRPPRVIKR